MDIQGLDESQFGMFHEHEQDDLRYIWNMTADRNPNRFISYLSPSQKDALTRWAVERASYSAKQLITALEKFTKYMKSAYKDKNSTYPYLKANDYQTPFRGFKKNTSTRTLLRY